MGLHSQNGLCISHRYLRPVDCSGHICLQKFHFEQARALVVGTNKADGLSHIDGPTRQAAGCIDAPALSANIFVAATSRTNIHNVTGDMCN